MTEEPVEQVIAAFEQGEKKVTRPPETWGFPINGRAVGTVSKEYVKQFETLRDAMDLLVELWPKPGYRSVTMETHQWVKLRKVLLAIPDLVIQEEDHA